jgi:putative transposase
MKVNRVEKHMINKNHLMYNMCDELCFKSKNMYNYANYIIRQIFITTSNLKNDKEVTNEQLEYLRNINLKVDEFNQKKQENLLKKQNNPKTKDKYKDKKFKPISYFDKDNRYSNYDFMDFVTKQSDPFKDLGSNSAQHTLKILDKAWKSFFVSIKDWSKHKEKYLGRPKLPKYKKKDGKHICVLTNMQTHIVDGYLYFAYTPLKPYNNLFKTHITDKLLQTRIIPQGSCYVLEIVYEKEINDVSSDFQSKRIFSIDIGVNNFATITNNIGTKPIIINGKCIKSYNQYWNKQISKYRSIAKKTNKLDWTNRLQKLTNKRYNKINYFLHNASAMIIKLCKIYNIDTIVIGYNKTWKQESKLHVKVNQTFVQIPFEIFIKQLDYKCVGNSIDFIKTNESYTSGTSFIDNESPIKENYDKSRRVFRGLFKSNTNKLINSDVNGSLQIMKKVFSNIFNDYEIEGLDLTPSILNI